MKNHINYKFNNVQIKFMNFLDIIKRNLNKLKLLIIYYLIILIQFIINLFNIFYLLEIQNFIVKLLKIIVDFK